MTSTPTDVTQADVTSFLNFAFRHIRLPLLDAGDIDDIRAGLENFARHRLAHQPGDGALRERIRTALYDGLSWFGTLPEPQGDVPERYHRWDDLGEFADRILAALSDTSPTEEEGA